MPFSRKIAVTSRWLLCSSPTAPSIKSSVPSRIFASGVFSSCDICRRNRFFSCARSSNRPRSHSNCAANRSRSAGPRMAMGLENVPRPSSLMARSMARMGLPNRYVNTPTTASVKGTSSRVCQNRFRCARCVASCRPASSRSICALTRFDTLDAISESCGNALTRFAMRAELGVLRFSSCCRRSASACSASASLCDSVSSGMASSSLKVAARRSWLRE